MANFSFSSFGSFWGGTRDEYAFAWICSRNQLFPFLAALSALQRTDSSTDSNRRIWQGLRFCLPPAFDRSHTCCLYSSSALLMPEEVDSRKSNSAAAFIEHQLVDGPDWKGNNFLIQEQSSSYKQIIVILPWTKLMPFRLSLKTLTTLPWGWEPKLGCGNNLYQWVGASERFTAGSTVCYWSSFISLQRIFIDTQTWMHNVPVPRQSSPTSLSWDTCISLPFLQF